MSNNRFIIFLLGFIALFVSLSNAKDSEFRKETQYYGDRFDIFFRPIKYTQSSIQCFLKHCFNNPSYAQRFLSLNFSHVETFLSYTRENMLPRSYAKSVLKLFGQKLKATTYINNYAFYELLEKMPILLKDFFVIDKKIDDQKEQIKQCIYDFFLNNFNQLKEDPESALDSLSSKIVDINQKKEEDISIEDLQQSVSQFLEIALSKFIWSPEDHQIVWESVKSTAEELEQLLSNNMLPNIETLDELYWTLIHRFSYFLDLSGAELNADFYKTVNSDLITRRHPLWNLEEREAYITTKYKHLKRAIVSAEVRSRAFYAGLITDIIPPAV